MHSSNEAHPVFLVLKWLFTARPQCGRVVEDVQDAELAIFSFSATFDYILYCVCPSKVKFWGKRTIVQCEIEFKVHESNKRPNFIDPFASHRLVM